MRLVQTLLTEQQAAMIEQALKHLLRDAADGQVAFSSQAEEGAYLQLTGFWQKVVEHPEAFPPRGDMARTVKSIVRRAKGPAQPPSGRRKKRKGK